MKLLIRKILKGSFYASLGEGLWQILNFFISLNIARNFGAGGFGKFSLALSIAAVSSMMVDSGITHLLIREVASKKDEASFFLRHAIKVRLLLSIIVLSFIGLIFLLLRQEINFFIYLMVTQAVIFTIATTYFAIYRAFGKFLHESLLKIINRLLVLLFLLLLGSKKEITYVGIAFFCASLITLFMSKIIKQKIKNRTKEKSSPDLIRRSLPFGIILIVSTFYYKSNTIFLSFLKDDISVGNYNVAFNILLLFLFIPTFLNISGYPLLSEKKNKLTMTNYLIKKYRIALYALGTISMLFLLIFGKEIILIFYGEEFINATRTLQILSVSLLFLLQNNASYLFFSLQRKEIIVTKTILLSTLILIPLSIMFINWLGIEGAAFAFLLTEIIAFITYCYQEKKFLRSKLIISNKF